MDVGSFSRAPSIITSTLGEILLGGWRDPAERMMKRRATNEKTEQRWKYSKESKVRPVVEITKKKKKTESQSGIGLSLSPTAMFPSPERMVDCKTKEKLRVCVLSVTHNRKEGRDDKERAN